jgi:hypothetical protein
LKTYNAPGLLEGGSEFTVAVAPDTVAVELHAAMKASSPTAPAPTNSAEPRKKLLRLTEDPKFTSVVMKDLLKNGVAGDEQIFGVTFTLFAA